MVSCNGFLQKFFLYKFLAPNRTLPVLCSMFQKVNTHFHFCDNFGKYIPFYPPFTVTTQSIRSVNTTLRYVCHLTFIMWLPCLWALRLMSMPQWHFGTRNTQTKEVQHEILLPRLFCDWAQLHRIITTVNTYIHTYILLKVWQNANTNSKNEWI